MSLSFFRFGRMQQSKMASRSKSSIQSFPSMQKRTGLLFLGILLPLLAFPQSTLLQQLRGLKGISITQKENKGFKEYYEIMIEQPLDHFNPSATFQQRIYFGFNDPDLPTVMETEGYAISNISKPQFISDCNVVSAEHRYFGKSAPAGLDWNYLTIKQAASDLHQIRGLFGTILKGKWITTGASKGGQTAIAYKMYFHADADATIAYVTTVKNSIEDKRLAGYMNSISKTENGKKVFAFQRAAFRNKAALLKEFDIYAKNNNLNFPALKNEAVLDYLLLEYPFAFFQNCFNADLIPDSTASATKIIEEITGVVPPRFYSDKFRARLQPSFYMFYHELGYYEYEIESLNQWLSQTEYPNSIFAPPTITAVFDPSYLKALDKFITDPARTRIIFIYGELDPYTSLRPALDIKADCYTYIVKNGCHKSRFNDLTKEQQTEIHAALSKWLL